MILNHVNRLLSSVKDWLDQGRWFQKSLFISGFILSLAFFLHYREVRIDHLELNSIAKKYVLAQVEFDFLDVEKTRLFREESLQDIGVIYYFDDEEIYKAESRINEEVIKDPKWRKKFASLTFEDLMHANNAIRDALLDVEFTDSRTVQKLEQIGMDDYTFLVCNMDQKSGKLMSSFWDQIEKFVFPDSIGEAASFMLEKYKAYPWKIEEDFDVRHLLRRKIKQQIPMKVTHVAAGTRIIDAGELVTRRHINMLQQMKKVLTEEKHLLKPLTILGSLLFSTILVFVGLIYFYKFQSKILKSFSKMSLIGVVILMTLTMAKLVEFFILHQPSHLVDMCRFCPYLLFSSIVLSILIDRTVALVVSGFVALVLGFTLAKESHAFIIMNLSTAVMGIIWTKGVSKRKEIFYICSKVFLCSIPLLFALNFLENQYWNKQVTNDLLTSGLFSLGIAIVIIAILPILESTFGIVTDMTLLESGDPSHPLLRRLSLEASGTYQHSLGVANLAEEAALAIGANALLCRISALYRDIGKIIQPNYFTENLREGFNMHQLLTPAESAQVIIQHVTEGIKLAENANLPNPIIDIIREHHGTTLVYSFYHQQVEKNRIKSLGVEEKYFKYAGPTPQSRESAIIMISDSIEAAYRCLHLTEEKVSKEFIEKIVDEKIREDQLDSSGLTFDDLEAIKKAILRSLLAIVHVRTAFPQKPRIVPPPTVGATPELT